MIMKNIFMVINKVEIAAYPLANVVIPPVYTILLPSSLFRAILYLLTV